MKAADLDEAGFLEAVSEAAAERGLPTADRWSVADRLGAPEKVVLAKAKKLIRRGVLEGCGCGCRGDWRAA